MEVYLYNVVFLLSIAILTFFTAASLSDFRIHFLCVPTNSCEMVLKNVDMNVNS